MKQRNDRPPRRPTRRGPNQPASADRPPRQDRPDVQLPPGTPVAHLRSAHWDALLYERMLDRVEGDARDGDILAVRDKHGRFFGWALYNSRSLIPLRMLSRDEAKPDEAFFAQRVAQAVSLRRDVLQLDRTTDAYRLIHAEGDGLSGLVADRFGDYVAIELFSLGMYLRLEAIEDAIVAAGVSVRQFVVRADKQIADQEGIPAAELRSPRAASAEITENGVRFHADLSRGHKTGFFCDQRDNRLRLTQFTPGHSVLDVCCYTGGFALYAAARGQAADVQAVDLDEKALAVAEKNAQLNGAKVQFTHADAFDFLRRAGAAGKQWDVVVVDPSKFVPRRSALETGLRKYADLNRLAAAVVRPGGVLLTCSCSGLVDGETFLQTVARACRSAGRTLRVFDRTGAAGDHPFQADTPQSAYLKALWGRLE